MSQQLAIIIIIDVAGALQDRTLKDNTYLFDNMKLQGSVGEGTGHLVSALNGTHWSDGSQADEQVLNWLLYSLGSIPPTVPRNFHVERARANDQEALEELVDLASRAGTAGTDVVAELNRIRTKIGTRTRVKSARQGRDLHTGHKVMDITGQIVSAESEDSVPALNNRAPVITNVTGEAVDKHIIYPAIYGSPDLVTDGWYWSASVATGTPGTYGYTMDIQLHELAWRSGGWRWEPVHMTYSSRIKITSEGKRNGFTKAGIGMLPILDVPVLPEVVTQRA